jgi:hypothetical protein
MVAWACWWKARQRCEDVSEVLEEAFQQDRLVQAQAVEATHQWDVASGRTNALPEHPPAVVQNAMHKSSKSQRIGPRVRRKVTLSTVS